MSVRGFEPRTTWLKVKCSTTWATRPYSFRKENAQNRNRTSDTRIFSPLLYRLSYLGKVAGTGFEPVTFGLWARRASELLYPASSITIVFIYDEDYSSNGRRRIRTFEGSASRFTVCPLWPLGNLPIKADERTRTVNLLITNQLLCQLSHIGVLIFIIYTVRSINGTYRARTCDPLLVRQMLSQLS